MSSASSRGSGIKSVQRGLHTATASSTTTVTVSAVNTAKAELRLLGYQTVVAGGGVYARLTNATTVTFVNNSGSDLPVSWELTEGY